MNKIIKNFILWLLISIILMFLFQNFYLNESIKEKVDYSTFINDLNNNKIEEVQIDKKKIFVINKNKNKYIVYIPFNDNKLLDKLLDKKIKIISNYTKKNDLLFSIFISWFPTLLLIAVWIFFIKQIQIGSKNVFNFSKNRAELVFNDDIKFTFSDVAGCDEAKEEISEIVEFLKNPNKFKKLGCKIPKGILMIGPTGTGKTLLAKAVAGESKVPFFNVSGSDFIEVFVGVGASRVRNMFNQAKKYDSCIIFIDEIDAIGRKRGYNYSGGNDEREHTLNQILVEMDGFNNNNIIILASTNRPDILDSALLRPGRFDRKIIIDLPNIKEREEILKIHLKKIPTNSDIDLLFIAKNTSGFSGADLANLINESALNAAKNNKDFVSMIDLEKSKDKIILGLEKKSLFITNDQKELTAYHESGHVIVSKMIKYSDPIYKVTIIPRGRSLGMTCFTQEEDIINFNKEKLKNKISILYGGRLAEELIYGKNFISIGSQDDIKKATLIARDMITKWGYSNKLGPIYYNYNEFNKDNSFVNNKYISEETNKLIDNEINLLIMKSFNITRNILIKNINILHKMKDELIKNETLNSDQIDNIIKK